MENPGKGIRCFLSENGESYVKLCQNVPIMAQEQQKSVEKAKQKTFQQKCAGFQQNSFFSCFVLETQRGGGPPVKVRLRVAKKIPHPFNRRDQSSFFSKKLTKLSCSGRISTREGFT